MLDIVAGIQVVVDSRQLLNVERLPADLANAAVEVATMASLSIPENPESWQIDLRPLSKIGRAHRKQWDVEAYVRKNRGVRSLLQMGAADGMDWSQYPLRRWGRYRQKLNLQMKDKVAEIFSDPFRSRTRPPSYAIVKGTYPQSSLNDEKRGWRMDKILSDFRLGVNASRTVYKRYYSREYCAELLSRSGVTSYNEALALLDVAFLKQRTVWSPDGRHKENLGAQLHDQWRQSAALIVVSIACQGSFQGERGWELLNQTLKQGGWPWLRRYPKNYARTIYLSMVCVFAVIRQNGPHAGSAGLLMTLAVKLVGPGPLPLRSSWLVRTTDVLGDEKCLFDPKTIQVPDQNGHDHCNSEIKPSNKCKTETGAIVVVEKNPMSSEDNDTANAYQKEYNPNMHNSSGIASTTVTEVPLPADKPEFGASPNAQVHEVAKTSIPSQHQQSPPEATHIIPGSKCNHGTLVPFTGRVKPAASLAELQELIGCRQCIVVTKSFGEGILRDEVLGYVAREGVLTVRRGEEQCVACAVKLAHAVHALVVVA